MRVLFRAVPVLFSQQLVTRRVFPGRCPDFDEVLKGLLASVDQPHVFYRVGRGHGRVQLHRFDSVTATQAFPRAYYLIVFFTVRWTLVSPLHWVQRILRAPCRVTPLSCFHADFLV